MDTNVLVAAAAARSPSHLTAVQALSQLESLDAPVWISRQVLREYLAVLSRPQTFATALPVADLVHDVRNFQSRYANHVRVLPLVLQSTS